MLVNLCWEQLTQDLTVVARQQNHSQPVEGWVVRRSWAGELGLRVVGLRLLVKGVGERLQEKAVVERLQVAGQGGKPQVLAGGRPEVKGAGDLGTGHKLPCNWL